MKKIATYKKTLKKHEKTSKKYQVAKVLLSDSGFICRLMSIIITLYKTRGDICKNTKDRRKNHLVAKLQSKDGGIL